MQKISKSVLLSAKDQKNNTFLFSILYHIFNIQKTTIYADIFSIMKCLRVLFAAAFGTLVYVVVSLSGGPNGLWAAKQLDEQKRVLSVRTAEIQKINNELFLEYTALQKDPDVIAAYARKLGYINKNEKIVKITGLRQPPVMLYNTGVVLKRQKIFSFPEWFCKALGLTVFMLSLVFMLLLDYNCIMTVRKTKRVEIIKGIPVYDLSQI